MNILIGLVIITIGALIVIKSEMLLNSFGRIAFFERYLGTSGGSRLGYKFVGMLVVFIGILIAVDLMGGFLEWITSPLTRYN